MGDILLGKQQFHWGLFEEADNLFQKLDGLPLSYGKPCSFEEIIK